MCSGTNVPDRLSSELVKSLVPAVMELPAVPTLEVPMSFTLELVDKSLACKKSLPATIELPLGERIVVGRGVNADVFLMPNAEKLKTVKAEQPLERKKVLSRRHVALTARIDTVGLDVLGRVFVNDGEMPRGSLELPEGAELSVGPPAFGCVYRVKRGDLVKMEPPCITAIMRPPFEPRPDEFWNEDGVEKIVVVAEFPKLCDSRGVPGHLTVLYLSDFIGRYNTGIRRPLTKTHVEIIERLVSEFNKNYKEFYLRPGGLDPTGPIVLFREAVRRETGLPFQSTDGDVITRGHVTAPFRTESKDPEVAKYLTLEIDGSRRLPLKLVVTSSSIPKNRANEHLAHVLLFMGDGVNHARTAVREATLPVTKANIDGGHIRNIPKDGQNVKKIVRARLIIACPLMHHLLYQNPPQQQDIPGPGRRMGRPREPVFPGSGYRLGDDDVKDGDVSPDEVHAKRLKRLEK